MKKLIALLLAVVMVLCLFACSAKDDDDYEDDEDIIEEDDDDKEKDEDEDEDEDGEAAAGEGEADAEGEAPAEPETEPVVVNTTINGICVDDSYVDSDGSPLRMVYLFYTLNAGDSNMSIDSKYTNMVIGSNTYESDNFANSAAAAKFAPNYYYSSYIEDVYVGTSIQVIATFKIPEGDLVPGKTITFSDSQNPDISLIEMTTDEIVHFSTPEEIAQAMDPDGFALEMLAREDADADTAQTVKNLINGYYWSFYVNSTYYEIEFWADNNFEVRTAYGSNSGTYVVKNGYIFCTYPTNGYTVEIPYEMVDGDVSLDVVAAFDVN